MAVRVGQSMSLNVSYETFIIKTFFYTSPLVVWKAAVLTLMHRREANFTVVVMITIKVRHFWR
jgi:hypothetical protein